MAALPSAIEAYNRLVGLANCLEDGGDHETTFNENFESALDKMRDALLRIPREEANLSEEIEALKVKLDASNEQIQDLQANQKSIDDRLVDHAEKVLVLEEEKLRLSEDNAKLRAQLQTLQSVKRTKKTTPELQEDKIKLPTSSDVNDTSAAALSKKTEEDTRSIITDLSGIEKQYEDYLSDEISNSGPLTPKVFNETVKQPTKTTIVNAETEEISDYEKLRERNIAEFQKMYHEIFKTKVALAKCVKKTPSASSAKRKPQQPISTEPRRKSCRLSSTTEIPPAPVFEREKVGKIKFAAGTKPMRPPSLPPPDDQQESKSDSAPASPKKSSSCSKTSSSSPTEALTRTPSKRRLKNPTVSVSEHVRDIIGKRRLCLVFVEKMEIDPNRKRFFLTKTAIGQWKLKKRTTRCGVCPPCMAKNCGECRHCLIPTMKQACIKRACEKKKIVK